VEVIDAARAYLPREIDKDAFITRVIEAVDNPRIIAGSRRMDIPWRGDRRAMGALAAAS
jgi:hypothetical protein